MIPRERMETVMREALYDEKSDVPYGRDSAFHILKQRYVGVFASSPYGFGTYVRGFSGLDHYLSLLIPWNQNRKLSAKKNPNDF